uniref:Uncharacterized protein n=1 Tax=Rhizophora mucronata TaxID=61149 RepID=A0A2P2PA25_RHIMU
MLQPVSNEQCYFTWPSGQDTLMKASILYVLNWVLGEWPQQQLQTSHSQR